MLPPETDLEPKGQYLYDISRFVTEATGSFEKDTENICYHYDPQSNVAWNAVVPPLQPFLRPSLCQAPEYAENGYWRQPTEVSAYFLSVSTSYKDFLYISDGKFYLNAQMRLISRSISYITSNTCPHYIAHRMGPQ